MQNFKLMEDYSFLKEDTLPQSIFARFAFQIQKTTMKFSKYAILLAMLILSAPKMNAQSKLKTLKSAQNEVIYHVFQRSFYDSNGDGHGDFNGLKSKLDYLEDLGVTSLLLIPIVESPFYHNYFSGDFEKIDPKYGSKEEWISLVKEVHKREMKIYMDLEFQYITEDHIWFKDSYQNRKSKYNNYVSYKDSDNKIPETMIFDLTSLTGYDSTKKTITTINMNSPEVLDYFTKLLSMWVDPDKNGDFSDGVDGFRLDHMMDKLDGKDKFKNLFSTFWKPLLSKLKTTNPNLKNVAEQADWNNYGEDYFKTGVDRVFAFNLKKAILTFDKKKILAAADTTFSRTPPTNQQIVFLENHDMNRVATELKGVTEDLKTVAAISLLIGGIPAIYYGQELGMKGSGGFQKFGLTDGNDIPFREAFEWYKSDSGKGMSVWYKNTGPWWTQTNLKPNDGISLEEQIKDPNSLWHCYQKLLSIRKSEPGIVQGKYSVLSNQNEEVLSFQKKKGNDTYAIVINLSDEKQNLFVDMGKNQFYEAKKLSSLFDGEKAQLLPNQRLELSMKPNGIGIFKVK